MENIQVNFCQPYLVNLVNKLEAEDVTWIKLVQNRWTGEAICEPLSETQSKYLHFIFHDNILFRKED